MKNILTFILLCLCLPIRSEVSYSHELEEIFSKLDRMILQREDYRLKKEERIKMLRNRMDMRASLEERFHTNKVLYDEYYVYNADSAMLYVVDNLRIASLLKRKDWEYTWRINKSFLLSATGLLKEAEDEMRGIPVHKLSDNAKVDYYSQMQYLFSHFGQYTGSESESVQRSYLDKELLYRDSVYMVARPDHPLYLWYKGCKLQYDGVDSMQMVVPELQKAIHSSALDNRYDAMNAYILGSIYRDLDDMDNYMKYLAYSPLEDVFHACFRRPKPEEEGDWFTAAEIFRLMNKRNASALRGISAKQLSFRLTAMGFKPRHTMRGNCYHVVQANAA